MENYPHYLERLQAATRKYWDKPALNNIGGETFTYAQMARSIARFHIVFEYAGIKKGDHIALCAQNGARWGFAYLAVNTYGTVIVPILADFKPDSVMGLVNHSESIVLFTDSGRWAKMDSSKMPNVRAVFDVNELKLLFCDDDKIQYGFDHLDELFDKKYPGGFGPDDVVFPTDNWDDLSTINYTSGSTGDPKGVMLTYRNFSSIVDYSQRHVPAGDKMVSMLPMAHMYGLVIEFLYPLSNGTSIYWLGAAPTPAALMKAFADVKPYLLITVPLVMEKIYKSKIKPMIDKPLIKFLLHVPGINSVVYKKIKDGLISAFGGNCEEFIMGGAALNPEVENSLTRKLEDALSSLQGVESMRSYSFESMSMVFVSFTYGTDIDKAMTDAQNKISSKKAELPSSILSPMINKITVDDKSIITMSVTSDLETTEFSDLVEHRLLPELLRVHGMAKVTSVGELPKEIQINLDMEQMRALGMTPVQVLGVLRGANLDFPTGSLRNGRTNTSIRLSGKLQTIDEIRSLVIMTMPNGTQIRLSDIAEITESAKDAIKLARVNGKEAVLLNIFKQSDANAIDLSDHVRESITQLEQYYSDVNLKMEIVSDTSDFTRESISSVLVDLLLAILLVTIVILLFLHNWRNALMVMLVVPLSLIGAFIGMQLFNFTLNLMSLLGLSVVIGVLVDDAIVVIENVYRHLEMGKNPLQATKDAMDEIGFTVITVTLVLVIVFLPIALTNSLVSDILRQFCGVIVFAILFSLLAALTLVPLLTSRFGKLEQLDTKKFSGRMLQGFENGIRKFGDWVAGILGWSLGHKRWIGIIVIAITVAIFSLFPMGFIGFQFMPDVDQSEFSVLIEMPKDISIEESSKMVAKAETWLLEQDEITEVVTMIGLTGSQNESTQGTPYLSEITVKMVPPSERDENVIKYIAHLRRELTDHLVDAKVKMFAASLHGSGNSSAVEYVINGSQADSVALFAEYALDVMRSIPGTVQQQISTGSGMPEVQVTVDREKMSALGLTLDNVGLTMQMAFQGNTSLKYVQNDYEYDINIRADKFYRENIDDVSNLTFVNAQGSRISLDQFAQVRLGTGPNRLERYNRNPSVTIGSNVVGISAGAVSSQFLEKVDAKAKQMGVSLETVGDMKSMMDSMSVMGIALLLSIILMYLAMVLLYNNWVDPLVVMFSIPFSILGAILALAMSGTSLNIYAMLGLVMLIGLVAKNAILLVDFANEQLAAGQSMDNALISAVKMRTRPILMTALSTIIGMIPVAVASGSSAELRNGIGWVIIGGMTLSTLLTLVVVPVVFKIFHRKQAAA